MSFRINNNIRSLDTYNNLSKTSLKMEKSINKLSSGYRINNASDDAAGLSISEKMRAQIRSINRANYNAQDAVSMLQTAEGGLNETESILQRMRELAIQASNDTLTSSDRLEIQKEIVQLRTSIDDLTKTTEFNTKKLLNGSQTAFISSSSEYVSAIQTDDVGSSGDYEIEARLLKRGTSQVQTTHKFIDKNTGELAKGTTKLEDIEQFYNANGVFALATPQKLTLTNNSASTEVTLDGKMTLNQLAATLQSAMNSSKGLDLKDSNVRMVNPDSNGEGGYLSLTSGGIGNSGDFFITGNQTMMDIFGFTVSRESKNNVLQVSATDIYGNKRTIKTSAQQMGGLIDGVDVVFDTKLTNDLSSAHITTNVDIIDAVRIPNTPYHGYGVQNYPIDMWVCVASAPGHNNGIISVNIDINISSPQDYSFDDVVTSFTSDITNYWQNFDGDKNWHPDTGLSVSIVNNEICITKVATADSPTTEFTIRQYNTHNTTNYLGIANGTYNGSVVGNKEASVAIRGVRHDYNSGKPDIKFNVSDGTNTTTVDFGRPTGANASILEINDLIDRINNQLSAAGVKVVASVEDDSIVFYSNSPEAIVETSAFDPGDSDQIDYINNVIGIPFAKAEYESKAFRVHVVDRSSQFQIGANIGQRMGISIRDMSAKALGIENLDMSTSKGAQSAIKKLDHAISSVSAERSKLGAYSNRLNHTVNNLENTATNLTDSESRIRDVDMAAEMINFISSQIMQQAGTAMLAQANTMGQSVLSLLG
ncbi:MAG: hypothetical protein J6Z11_15570 [Candidatus Riflebacteria bacterium]|nr:hypothetical protein [Candidatus Riflebacteria bacterium]